MQSILAYTHASMHVNRAVLKWTEKVRDSCFSRQPDRSCEKLKSTVILGLVCRSISAVCRTAPQTYSATEMFAALPPQSEKRSFSKFLRIPGLAQTTARATAGLALMAVLTTAAAFAGGETYRLVKGARYVQASADGVFVLTSKREPTPGAWIQDCTYLVDSLTRLDGKTGAVLWSTCLPIEAENLLVDARGAVTIAGGIRPFPGGLRATPGAYASPRGNAGIAVMRLNPDGSAPEWIATVTGDPGFLYTTPTAIAAIGADGSVYGAATVTTNNLPVTEGALQTQKQSNHSAYFFRLSADGSRLIYGTYINEGSECFASALITDAEGNVFTGGACDSFLLNEKPSMATPGTFTTERSMWTDSAWVARFDPAASRFRYIAVFGQLVGLRISLASAGRGRVAIAGTMISGVLPTTPGAVSIDRPPGKSESSFFLVLAPDASTADVSGSYGVGTIAALERDTDGNLLIIGGEAWSRPGLSVVTTSADAWRPVNGEANDSGFILKLKDDGTRVVYSTGIGCRACSVQNAAAAGDMLWIAVADGTDNVRIGPAQPTTVPRHDASVIQAIPDNWPDTRQYNPGAVLSWHTRDVTVRSAEIRRDTPNGPVVARGTSGAIVLDNATATYYFVSTTGGPFSGRVLGSETFTRHTPLSGTSAAAGYGLTLDPNPVLACRATPATGTQTRVVGWAGGDWTYVRVGAPNGPLMVAGKGSVNSPTGDWVQNGMPFFLATPEWGVLGSVRAYLLPNRSCSTGALDAMIRATRDCADKNRFTLAWYTGKAPAEIREEGATGPKVARFSSISGLFDVTASTPRTYVLMAWENGEWTQVATTTADPRSPCEQGSAQ